jgi:hypothetical protein
MLADDQMLLAGNEDDLQRATAKSNEVLKVYNMNIVSRERNYRYAWTKSQEGKNSRPNRGRSY